MLVFGYLNCLQPDHGDMTSSALKALPVAI